MTRRIWPVLIFREPSNGAATAVPEFEAAAFLESAGVAKPWWPTLAEMTGTTRSRVNFLLNKFKKLRWCVADRNRPETVVDTGPLHATADRQKTLTLPPVVGVGVVAGGVVLLIAGMRKHTSRALTK
jgi:hypothetical protein